MSAVPRSVPAAVALSTSDSVSILTEPQLGPYTAPSDSSIIPTVPRSDDYDGKKNMPPGQPVYGHANDTGTPSESGSAGAPSVPVDGFLFHAGPIDSHYQVQEEGFNPYLKVNSPPTRGMFTWVKGYLNHFAQSQNTTNTGFKINGAQQRTSYMRYTGPPHADGYDPQNYTPQQLPQAARTQQFIPVTGSDPYGSGVLNSDTLGAGQTAGGQGGSNYTPAPGPPPTITATGNDSGMPTWG